MTGSSYNEIYLQTHGFPAGHTVDGTVVAVKTHRCGAATIARFDRAILLVRNPFDSLVAEFNRKHGGGHTGLAVKEKWQEHWQEFVAVWAGKWEKVYLFWVRVFAPRKRLIIVHYEDLVNDLRSNLVRIIKFLGEDPRTRFNVSEGDLDCVLKHREGAFRRRKLNKIPMGVFDQGIQEAIKKRIRRVYHALNRTKEYTTRRITP